MENFGIPGLTRSGTQPPEPPILVVSGAAKCGKSTLATTLKDWPAPGNEPLVIAFDAGGPDSCTPFGGIQCVKVKQAPGNTFWEKSRNTIANVENAFRRRGPNFPFTSIVVDCGSTLTDILLREAKVEAAQESRSGKADGRQVYGKVLERSSEVMWRLMDLSIPTIWLCWLREPFHQEEGGRKKQVLGGPLLDGSFKAKLAGRADGLFYLEKVKVGQGGKFDFPNGLGAVPADPQGYVRVLHSRTYDNVECGGRYSHLFPEPCPPHLGWILSQLNSHGQTQPATAAR